MRMTKQRKVILEELSKVKCHPSADQVYHMVRKRLPQVSLATVYRNLEALSETGTILKLEMGGTQRKYDADTSEHHHVRCIQCNRVDDLPGDAFRVPQIRWKGFNDFEIHGYRLEFLGLCGPCREKAAAAGPGLS